MTQFPEKETPAIKLIISYRDKNQFFYDTLRDFEKIILESGSAVPVLRDKIVPFYAGQASYNVYRALTLALGVETALPLPILPGRGSHYMAILMGLQLRQCLPYFAFAKRKSLYLFDAWEKSQPLLQQFIRHFAVDDVFISSWEVTEKFRNHDRTRRYHWIPEGIDPSRYTQIDYTKKDIDILQLGRRYDAYHDQIVMPLQKDGFNYLYEKAMHSLIFRTREDFALGLARSKISICVPSNITHPERSGSVSTMTNRYLQSMVSKCLVVGIKPAEMDMLFDYNPMIEIDRSDPVGQLREILANHENYLPLVEKNYQTVCRDHTWSNRWIEIKRAMF